MSTAGKDVKSFGELRAAIEALVPHSFLPETRVCNECGLKNVDHDGMGHGFCKYPPFLSFQPISQPISPSVMFADSAR